MAARDGELRVFLVAGEVSGDSIASRLMASLKILSPFPLRFAGVGGGKMASEGLQSLFPIEDISVMGLWELLPHLYRIRVKLNETVEAAALFEPHVVLTVDSKGFCFWFLKVGSLLSTQETTVLLFSGQFKHHGLRDESGIQILLSSLCITMRTCYNLVSI
ncbi:lipid-A-disaccharide synthase [Spatholobus suberectus]|nr:lipid-A-disaccharide synthase [Spatholobus suberectus]